MNIESLEVGNTYKNYRHVCEILNETIKTGRSKELQLKNWGRFFKYIREGNKWIITEIFDIPKEKLSRHQTNSKYESIKITNPDIYNRIIKVDDFDYGILSKNSCKEITLNCEKCGNNYITTVGKATSKKNITCHVCSMSEGERRIYNYLKDNNIEFIKEYTFKDLLALNNINKLRFDFAIFKNDKLTGIIEFDGSFHYEDLNPNSNEYKKQHYYDMKKNEYCLEHDIPLKRISFKNIDIGEMILCKFLSDIGFNRKFHDRYTELLNIEESKIIKEINKLTDKLNKLQEL